MLWKKNKKTEFSKKDIDSDNEELLNSINEALNKINDGYQELVKLNVIKNKKRKIIKLSASILAIITILFAYLQYLEKNIESRIETHEQMFLFSVNNLESNSEVVRANGIKSLENIAFTKLICEPQTGAIASMKNLWNWIINKQEYIFMDRARIVFTDYARSERKETKSIYNPVSTTILTTGLNWIQKEKNILNKDRSNRDLWFFYKSDLQKANCPNKNFKDLMFADVNFNSSNLQSCLFSNAYLEKANFNNSNLQSSEFIEATIRNANFEKALLNFTNFEKAKGQEALFIECDFSNARLDSANFIDANFNNTIFNNASLKNTNFKGSSMIGCDFMNANLDSCIFDNCDLTGAKFDHADISKIKSIQGAILSNIVATEEQKEILLIKNQKK